MALFGGTKGGPDDYQSLLAKGDLEGAIKILRRLARKTPEDFTICLQYAEACEKAGKREDAAAEFFRVGELQEKKGYGTKALALFRRAEKLTPDRADIKAKLVPKEGAASVNPALRATQVSKKSADDSFEIDMDMGGDSPASGAELPAPDEDFSADDLPAIAAEPEELAAAEPEAAPEIDHGADTPPGTPDIEPTPESSKPAVDTAALLAASAAAEGEAEAIPEVEPEIEPEPAQDPAGEGGLRPMLSGILAELSADDVSLLVERFTERTYEPGERIITEGDEGESMYFIRSGLVRVSTLTDAGLIELGELKPGDYFGEVSLLKRVKRTATISAVETTELQELTRENLDALRPSIPDLLEKLEAGLARRAMATIQAITAQLSGN